MAAYEDLYELRFNTDLQNKIAVAVAVAAQTILSGETPTAAQAAWARAAVSNPKSMAETVINLVLAANKSATTAQILAATEAKQLIFIGVVPLTNDAATTVQYCCVNSYFVPPTQYGMPIVKNEGGQAFEGDAVEMFVALVPITENVAQS